MNTAKIVTPVTVSGNHQITDSLDIKKLVHKNKKYC